MGVALVRTALGALADEAPLFKEQDREILQRLDLSCGDQRQVHQLVVGQRVHRPRIGGGWVSLPEGSELAPDPEDFHLLRLVIGIRAGAGEEAGAALADLLFGAVDPHLARLHADAHERAFLDDLLVDHEVEQVVEQALVVDVPVERDHIAAAYSGVARLV